MITESVIALDPGGRSGYAAAIMGEDYLELTETGVLRQDFMARWLAARQRIWMDLTKRHYDVIVGESWIPRRKNGSMAWIEGDPLLSAQHVGQIRLIADLSGARYVEQPPSNKEMYTASMPKALLELDADSNEQHDKDARMHLWGYFKDNWFSATVDPESVVHV